MMLGRNWTLASTALLALALGATALPASAAPSMQLFDFESGVQGWTAEANVSGVASVTTFANQPTRPEKGTHVLEATTSVTAQASSVHTVSVTFPKPVDLSKASQVSVWFNSYGLAGDETSQFPQKVEITVLAGSAKVSASVSNYVGNSWIDIVVPVKTLAGRKRATGITVDMSIPGWPLIYDPPAVNTGRFQLDDITAS